MGMKKFINDPNDLTKELLEGFAIACGDKIKIVSDKIVVRAEPKSPDKVALVTLGGAGHEPALSGFVGKGLLDASVVGDIFAAPGGPKVFEALKMFNRPAGILFIVLNHAGDVLNGNLAMKMADKEGIKYKMILTHEDIAPAPMPRPRTAAGWSAAARCTRSPARPPRRARASKRSSPSPSGSTTTWPPWPSP